MQVPPLVSPHWLHEQLDNPQLGIIENAWDRQLYARGHIPGALATPLHPHLKHFSADGVKSAHLLTPAEFSQLCQQLGLQRQRHYVIYDDWHGLFAARFWWLCRYYGVDNISILDGGWQGWCQQDYPVSQQPNEARCASDISPLLRPALLIGKAKLQLRYRDAGFQLWDTRRPAEYWGEEQSGNRRQGHIPGALNLDWTCFLSAPQPPHDARYLRPREELQQLVDELGLRRERTIVPYCQSGIRAAFACFVLQLLKFPAVRLYDGSMFEWANQQETPLA